ncbi:MULTISPECIES: diaminopimelate decarboxylase [Spongiibacter]|uniref:diaminopimelate decarboxylase n=1 Tax=Spongiibacter TaxID=630749 RepID=UPI000C35398A|nr:MULTISPECIES: diaminopimelate decarboxylase [Spongiibacter]MAY38765.1 diaminopimelate decarboxylase [Spongiibacter sp.]MBI57121.1 diaminopimelate decarboxylase [Spongiibacter sp.]|tara:strand:- start:453 stop:1703 length:1251 start_codon:yes stop_codon:yes gene_type:complete
MTVFHYQSGELFAESVSLRAIAEQYGTPCYVYSRAYLEQRFSEYSDALQGQDHLVCYAVKANSNIAVLNVLARLGAGFDIVSVGELERVLAAGGPAERVVFSGVGKTAAEMRRALEVGIYCFNVESEAELERLNAVAAEMGVVAPVSIRVNPDVDAKTHPYISTGLRDNKFGIDIARAPEVYAHAASLSNLAVKGVDCHIGSQLTDTSPFLDALDRVLMLVDTLAEQSIDIAHLDLGGGLGVRYRDEQPPSTGDYIAAIRERLGERQVKLMFEPGRSITANAGVLLTQVEFLKLNPHKNFAIVDAAMNDMLRPALYQAWMDLLPVVPRSNGEARHYDVVGPVCETGDFIAKDRELRIESGDLLALASSGAYGFTMSSNYNSRGRAAEVMVDGDQHHLIRARETVADLMRGEAVLPD